MNGGDNMPPMGLKGRSTDRRQDPYYRDFKSENPPDRDDWLLYFPEDQYPNSQSFMGAIPVAVVGHKEMDDREWEEFVEQVHYSVFPRQATAPAFLAEPNPMLDMRNCTRDGDYHPVFWNLDKKVVKEFEDIQSKVDNLHVNPVSHPQFMPIVNSGKVHRLRELEEKLDDIARNSVEPHNRDATMGDVANNLSHPFGNVGIY